MGTSKLQPERVTATDGARVATHEIIEIRNITLKEALQMVRALADQAELASRSK
jgi:hypothetical protein